MRNRLVLPAPFSPRTNNRSPRPRSKVTSSNTGGPPYPLHKCSVLMTVTPHEGGSGNFTCNTRPPVGATTFSPCKRSMRFSILCAIAAFVALAPNRSTTVCKRLISLDCKAAFFIIRSSSSARERRYWLYVPLYSTICPVASSASRSRCKTRVMASSSSSRS